MKMNISILILFISSLFCFSQKKEALKKPLIAVSSDDIDELYADSIAKLALIEYENSGLNSEMFNPKNANPIYSQELQYKKVNE